MIDVEDSKRRLMWHGMFLFLLGLLTGLVEAHFTNPRMGLAAHLEGVMNGIFLVALGAIWTEVATRRGSEGCRVLEHVVRHLRQLGRHHAGGNIWRRGPFAGYRWPRRAALAGDAGDGRLHDGRDCDHCRFRACAVGIAARRGCVIRIINRCTDILLRPNSRSRPAATVDFRSGRIALFGSTASAESSADKARTSQPFLHRAIR